MRSHSSKELSGGCLSLFGMPFFCAGLFLTYLYFSGYVQWWNARNWTEVPCQIESADLVSGSKSSKATATYHYEIGGRKYFGDRVSFYSGSDNIGNFQQSAHREISRYLNKKPARPFRCFVDPEDPSSSVLYRILRWPMQIFMAIFALTFPAVGAGIISAGFAAMNAQKAEAKLRDQYPTEPWKWKICWSASQIPESERFSKNALIAYTCWFWAIVTPLLAAMVTIGAFQNDPTAKLALILPLIGLVPTVLAWKRLRHKWAVGAAGLELKMQPANPGDFLSGDIVLVNPLPALKPVEVILKCQKSITKGSGKNSSTTTEEIWSQVENVASDSIIRDLTGYRIPVRIAIPADAPESTVDASASEKIGWQLQLKVPGTSIHSKFDIPVFHTGAEPNNGSTPLISESVARDLPELLASQKIKVTFDAAGLPQSIICPLGRYLGLLMFLILFNLVWTGIAAFLIYQEAPWIFRILWPISAAAIWCSIIWVALHKRTVTFDDSGLTIQNQLGPVIWTSRCAKSEIAGFRSGSNMSSGNQKFYQVSMARFSGKNKALVDGITGSTTADATVDLLEKWHRSGQTHG